MAGKKSVTNQAVTAETLGKMPEFAADKMHSVPNGFEPAASPASRSNGSQTGAVPKPLARRRNEHKIEPELVDENLRPIPVEDVEAPAVLPEDAEPGLPEWIAQELEVNGLDPADFASPKAASRVLNQLRASTRQLPPVQQVIQQAPQAEKPYDPFEGFDRKGIKEEFGEKGDAILDLIGKVAKNSHETNQMLARHNQNIEARLAHQQGEVIDSHFESLNEKYDGAFGEGFVNPNSIEYRNRADVYATAQGILQSGRAASMKAAITKAAKALISEDVRPAPKKESKSPEASARASQAVGFSTVGRTPTDLVNPKEKALKRISQFLNS